MKKTKSKQTKAKKNEIVEEVAAAPSMAEKVSGEDGRKFGSTEQEIRPPEEKTSFFSSWDWKTVSAIAIGVAIIIFYINMSLFSTKVQTFAALNALAVVVALGVPVYVRYREYSRAKEVEHMFPALMRDITESVNVGMSLTKAIRTTTANDYGALTPYVKDMAAKIDWGIPFEKVLTDFASKIKSHVIGRAVKGVIEAHRSGGTINTVLQAMTVSVRELERIRKERATRVYSQMVTGYFIFFLFLGIMLAMAKLLIPVLTFQLAGAAGVQDITMIFTNTFRALVVVQGLFAGLGIGKMSEGTITAGFKHAFVLAIIGYTMFVIF